MSETAASQDLRANSKVGAFTTRESPTTRSLPKRAPLRDGLPFAHGRAALLKRSGAISPLRRGACGGIVARTTDRRAFAMRRGDTVTRITRRMNVSNLLIEKLQVLQLRISRSSRQRFPRNTTNASLPHASRSASRFFSSQHAAPMAPPSERPQAIRVGPGQGARPRLRASGERLGGAGKRALKPATASADTPGGGRPLPSGAMTVDSRSERAPRAAATLALALLFGLAASEAHAGIAFVKNLGTATGNNTGTTIAITLQTGVSVAAGNSVILTFVSADLGTTGFSATDSAGNTYTVDKARVRSGSVGTVILSAHNLTPPAAGNIITVTFPSTTSRPALTADEFSGLAKSGTLDKTSTGNGSSTTPDSGFTATTTQAAELLLGAIGVAGAAGDTFTASDDGHGGIYTALTRVNSGGNVFYVNPEYEIVAVTNTYKARATITSQNWAADIATYKADSNCGNSIVDAGEDCDQGASNGTAGSCCSAACRFVPSTTVCRAAANECDLADSCTGSSATCPADAVKAAGTVCTDDGNACTTDVCNGTAGAPACTHPAGNAGTVCRAAAGECDLAETCDGSSTACPTDVFKASGTTCTDDGNACTTDVCNGASATCTHPAGNAGALCRAAAGECDVAENCTGTSTTCPTDAKQPVGTACTADTNPCTLDH